MTVPLDAVHRDITTLDVEAIVSAANNRMRDGGLATGDAEIDLSPVVFS